ncbi:MAG: hypothetical protein JEZ00_01410 [Anaerolineaceae bacterium]|nr:hypothetical protein [Anaerolineaceae bacterium]
MKKSLFLLALVLLLLSSAFSTVPHEINLEWLQIELWPEYDREDMLVIYRFSLASDTALPTALELHIPSEAGDAYQVAMRDIDGLLYHLDYSLKLEGDWMVVSFITPSPEVQIEFYDPRLRHDGIQRSYNFRWYGDYLINNCSIHVKEPLNTTNLRTLPATEPGVGVIGDQQNYEAQLGMIERGSSFYVRLTYDKSDDLLLSSLSEKVQPAAPIDDQIRGRTSFKEILPWVFGMLGIVLLFAILLLYVNSRQLPKGDSFSTDTANQLTDYSDVEPKAVYCHRCGKRAVKGDFYCRICGEKLRME